MTHTPGRVIVDALEGEGVGHVYGLPGGHVLSIYDGLYASPSIRHILVRHEHAAACMAAAHAQLTGTPGVCLVTAGPGATNLLTGVAEAFVGSLPLIILAGRGSTATAHRGASQEVATDQIFAPVTKWAVRVDRADLVPDVMRQAFTIARGGRPGPVLIDLPRDVLDTEIAGVPTCPPRRGRVRVGTRGRSIRRWRRCSAPSARCSSPAAGSWRPPLLRRSASSPSCWPSRCSPAWPAAAASPTITRSRRADSARTARGYPSGCWGRPMSSSAWAPALRRWRPTGRRARCPRPRRPTSRSTSSRPRSGAACRPRSGSSATCGPCSSRSWRRLRARGGLAPGAFAEQARTREVAEEIAQIDAESEELARAEQTPMHPLAPIRAARAALPREATVAFDVGCLAQHMAGAAPHFKIYEPRSTIVPSSCYGMGFAAAALPAARVVPTPTGRRSASSATVPSRW